MNAHKSEWPWLRNTCWEPPPLPSQIRRAAYWRVFAVMALIVAATTALLAMSILSVEGFVP